MKKKQCFKCLETLPISSFYVHPRMADGHLNKCKECAKFDSKNVDPKKRSAYDLKRWERPERRRQVRASVTAAAARDPVRYAKYKTDYYHRYPERWKARTTLGNAVRDGRIVKQPCEKCGAEKVQAHHEDYNKPLDVHWLCSKCHGLEHRKQR